MKMHLETRRQLIHMSGIAVAFYVLWAHEKWGFYIPLISLLLLAVLLYLISLCYKHNLRVPIAAWLIDISERQEVIRDSPARGALMFLLGSLLALLFFNVHAAAAAIAVLALGDSFSTLVGRWLGNHRLPYNPEKSMEGSLAGFAAAFLGASLIVSPATALLGALAGMLAESLPLKLDDNLSIPLSAGLAMALYGLV